MPHARAGSAGRDAVRGQFHVRRTAWVLAHGQPAADAVRAPDGRRRRPRSPSSGIVDARPDRHVHRAGSSTGPAAGRGQLACQGNILTGADVVDALFDTFLAGGAAFPELMLGALKAADTAGGDKRGRESAALLIVRENAGYGGNNDRWIDLRVDDHPAPSTS